MSKMYEDFKIETLNASKTVQHAQGMGVVSEELQMGFDIAMREAREAFLRVEDNYRIESIDES